MHNNNIIHREINPQALSIESSGKKMELIKFFDFGFWKYYKHFNIHIPYKKYNKIIGNNIIFGSINSLTGIELSRRDDLISLEYILIYLIKGCLPWENIKKNKKEKIKDIIKIKKLYKDKLVEGLPEEIKLFFNYINNLKFEEEPDYLYLKNLLKIIINTENSEKNYYFDITK